MTACDGNDARRDWLAVLARASRQALEQAAARVDAPEGETVRAAECGMVMLRGRVGGTGEGFNLGEASVTRGAVRIGAALGVGYALGRDRRKAVLIAVFDALLQDDSRRSGLMREVIEPLREEQAARHENESRRTASSRVDFFTMVRGEA
ncbi:MAG TPA: phosphonate C-P lyase system protein PhnG [Ramlibacter sp.]|nr:phosphonate C-P lyase system protein PhnG [Ramlibacter sp.]